MGLITCCSLSQLKSVAKGNDLNLMVVRNLKEPIANCQQFLYLAPSIELYSFFMENKERDGWWDVYKSVFLQELNTDQKRIGIRLVRSYLDQGFNVNLICYCGDYKYCHRSLLAEHFKSLGLEVRLC